nr:PREDICTED: apolipoprotein L6-like isoform X2 [Latimeria chalumnae]|eukprot:XP_014352953.1 PREDICTED: apolipoprotein L6-like isoform X2 [Latimeria chalumnae]
MEGWNDLENETRNRTQSLRIHYEDWEEALKELKEVIRSSVSELKEVGKTDQTVQQAASVGGIVSGALNIAGLLFAVPTGGASLALNAIGVVTGVGAGVASVANTVTTSKAEKKWQEEVKKYQEKYNEKREKLVSALGDVSETFQKLSDFISNNNYLLNLRGCAHAASQSAFLFRLADRIDTLHRSIDNLRLFYRMGRSARQAAGITSGAKALVSGAQTAAKRAAALGVAVSGIFIALDIYTLATCSSDNEVAKQLEKYLECLENEESELTQAYRSITDIVYLKLD